MKNLDLATLGVEEMNEVEIQNVDGGVNWWMYAIAPGTAYILSKFEEGYGQPVFTI